jgi:hypothetical protein
MPVDNGIGMGLLLFVLLVIVPWIAEKRRK